MMTLSIELSPKLYRFFKDDLELSISRFKELDFFLESFGIPNRFYNNRRNITTIKDLELKLKKPKTVYFFPDLTSFESSKPSKATDLAALVLRFKRCHIIEENQ
jgi:hypothetical protein